MSSHTKVVITSQNPAKIKAVESAFKKVFHEHEFEFVGVKSESGVGDQPMSKNEAKLGAINRISNIENEYEADYFVSLEAGVEFENEDLFCFGFVAIKSGNRLGVSQTSMFILPPKVAELIKNGMELGDADNLVFGVSDSKKQNGAVGLLTKDAVTRSSMFTEAVCLALIPFLNQDLFKS